MGIIDKFMFFAAGKNSQLSSSAAPQQQSPDKVLVVEADNALGNQLSQMLKEQNFEVASVGNGAEGLNMLLTFKPDVILLDLMLPVMDGKAMLHHLRALPEYKTTHVVVISDTGDIDTMRQVNEYDNASAFLIKSNVSVQDIINSVISLR